MQIFELPNQYTSTNVMPETVSTTRGVETLVSAIRNLTVGNIFEGTVTSIKGNQVLLGLSGGEQLQARVEADMQLVQGQSMFFQVKSNDGNAIAIRPYTIDGNGANLTLLNALKAANLPVKDRYLTMANTMMQEQMPIDKNSMNQMARVLRTYPSENVTTLVQMKKLHLPINVENIAQFENYANDRNALHSELDRFVLQLPETMASDTMTKEQMQKFDSQLLWILTEGLEEQKPQDDAALRQPQNATAEIPEHREMQLLPSPEEQIPKEKALQNEPLQNETIPKETTAKTPQPAERPVLERVTETLTRLYGDIGITKEDSGAGILRKLADFIAKGDNVTKGSLQTLFAAKDVQNLLKEVIREQFLLEPKDVKHGEKLKKLYDTLDAKVQNIENLLQSTGPKETALSHTLREIHANVEFMNQINEAYTFAQIPLKMHHQNASGQLYVYTNKRNLADPERDLSAFLHLDLENLGATDVSVRMHQKEVSTRFYMESDAAYHLVKAHMGQLEERIREKGYYCKIEIEKEECHVNFVEDFLKKEAPSAGMLHRYSFDVRM